MEHAEICENSTHTLECTVPAGKKWAARRYANCQGNWKRRSCCWVTSRRCCRVVREDLARGRKKQHMEEAPHSTPPPPRKCHPVCASGPEHAYCTWATLGPSLAPYKAAEKTTSPNSLCISGVRKFFLWPEHHLIYCNWTHLCFCYSKRR